MIAQIGNSCRPHETWIEMQALEFGLAWPWMVKAFGSESKDDRWGCVCVRVCVTTSQIKINFKKFKMKEDWSTSVISLNI